MAAMPVPSNHPLAQITRQVASELGWNVKNHGEARLALMLKGLGFSAAEFETQFALGPYRLDFALPLHQIDIEADGWVHTAATTKARDKERDRRLREWGWTVIRVDIDADGDEIIAQLQRHLPPRQQIRDYGLTLRAAVAAFQLQRYRLQRRGVTSPQNQLNKLRESVDAAAAALLPPKPREPEDE